MSFTEFPAAEPPRIPPASTGPEWFSGLPLLLWVHTGSAKVPVEDDQVHHLTAGEGIAVPADMGRRIETDADSVAFPYLLGPEAARTLPDGPKRFLVRDEWRDWLIMHYAHMVAPISSFGYRQASLLGVLGSSNSSPPPSGEDMRGTALVMPRSHAARTVAEELLRAPAQSYTVEGWAALTACSTRTLRREFLRETGITFSQWRSEARIWLALELLLAGYEVHQVAERVGFESRNGFTRAFQRSIGDAPSEFARGFGDPRGSVAHRARALSDLGALAALVSGPGSLWDIPEARRPFPATQTKPHTNNVHVLTWSYKGQGFIRSNGQTHIRRRGDALWIPAGVEHVACNEEKSLGLPVGYVDASDALIQHPIRAHFPPRWETYLLHCSVSACTRVRPVGYQRNQILEVFREQLTAQRANAVPMPKHPRARSAAHEFLRYMGSRPGFEADPKLQDIYRRETGMTFGRWQHVARMGAARELLGNGAKPSSVFRQVGYTQLSNFSRAFRGFHGLTPREYQARQSG